MRERMDFYSITKIIRDNSSIEELENVEYFHTLFFYVFEQEKYKIAEPDEGNLSRIFTGKRGISKDIVRVYQEEENIKYLLQGVSRVLEYSLDREYIGQEIEKLLQGDKTISFFKRRKLLKKKQEIEAFIAECLLYGMSRKMIETGADDKRKKKFLVSDYLYDYHFPAVGKVFWGREQELEEIHRCMEEKFSLFLEGIGGIGKSELAKQYAKKYKKKYEDIIYLRYTDSLKKTIAGMDFIDDDKEMSENKLFQEHYKFFKMLDSDMLVILDNFDTLPDEEELFHEFLSMEFRLLVTTRSHIEEVNTYQVNEIEDMENLLNIFYAYAPKSNQKESVVIDIIEEVFRHTLTVEMAAKP